MKKVIIAMLIAVAAQSSFAQSAKFGVKAGVTLPKLLSKADGGSLSTESDLNFMIGGYADLKFGGINLQPGLALIGKGGKSSDAGDEVSVKLMYLELPVNVLHHFPIGIGSVYVGAGPYAAYGISGTINAKVTSGGNAGSDSENLTFGNGDDDIKPFDFGINTLGGLQLKNEFNVGVNYGIGLSSLNNLESDGKTQNRVLSFTVGYFF